MAPPPQDHRGRPLRSLRLSVTDRCNLRCGYCMPEEQYTWLPKASILSYDELARAAHVFARLGVTKLRLTGGEPLLRRDLPELVRLLAAVPGVEDLALTTNALRLDGLAGPLRAAGLDRVTVSLDTLRPDRFATLTRRDELERAIAGIDAAREAGFGGTKLNTVVLRGENDDELTDVVEFARGRALEPRFIEYMDVGGATRWSMDAVVPASEILRRLGEHYGAPEPLEGDPAAPADRFRLPDGFVFGIVASTTRPFCGTCDRARLTADGRLFTCLYARDGFPLLPLLRDGRDDDAVAAEVAALWSAREDRGAEERLALASERTALADPDALRDDPHLEMHTRGG